ncbi:hypothetical protein [Streptomyces sp. NPDC056670]|uniref:hypothetical protein n=1 Tax=Streptomyces sp. NPDC056670 TaxID=3345904 RepID=UPI00368346C1
MTSRYDQLDARARFFLENWDEIDLAEMCASSETAAKRQQAAIERVRALAADMRTWCSPHNLAVDYADHIEQALNPTQEPS